ncbi:hypothetical protein [Burkholderia ubonensis]|uniref:hypothetical protein n=1 Tax=Burkholderia ubonensis TaxID=101571 RepID=UPI000A79BF9D|nr:hypothetical protein [Burkholderia ubonensis]
MNNYRYYAFLDLLGYRELIAQDLLSRSAKLKDRLTNSFSALNDINETDVRYTAISDSVFVCLLNGGLGFLYFADVLRRLQLSFLRNGLLIRGGVAFDEHFENGKVTYSPALVSAYDVESRRAFFPRVLLHQAVVDKLKNEGLFDRSIDEGRIIQHAGSYQIHFVDDDNWNSCFENAKDLSREQQEIIKSDPRVYSKYWYLQEYLMHCKPRGVRRSRYLPAWGAHSL